MTALGPLTKYHPITKTFDLHSAREVIPAVYGASSFDEAVSRGADRLQHTSLGRRRDVARLIVRHLLGCSEETWSPVPLADSLGLLDPDGPVARGLAGVLYALNTPLSRAAIGDLFLSQMGEGQPSPGAVNSDQWMAWLRARLTTDNISVVRRTRQTQVSMLRRFGFLAAPGLEAGHVHRPSPLIYAAALALDFHQGRWSVRSEQYALGPSGPRSLCMASATHARQCLGWAEEAGLVSRVHVGSEIDVRMDTEKALDRVGEMLRHA